MALQQKRCELEEQGCGGCDLLSLPYEKQLQKKQKELKALLGKFRKLQPILGMEEPWHYRNKVISTFTYHERKLDSGIYIQGTHKVLPVKSCLLHQMRLWRQCARLPECVNISPMMRTDIQGFCGMCWRGTACLRMK